MPPALAPDTLLSFSSLPTQGPSFPPSSASLVTHLELGDAAVGMLSFSEAFTFPKLPTSGPLRGATCFFSLSRWKEVPCDVLQNAPAPMTPRVCAGTFLPEREEAAFGISVWQRCYWKQQLWGLSLLFFWAKQAWAAESIFLPPWASMPGTRRAAQSWTDC